MIDTISRLNTGDIVWEKSKDYTHQIKNPNAPLYYIYRHYHIKKVNGVDTEFSYVGFARDPNKRWKEHVKNSKSKHCAAYGFFQKALSKYSKESFKHEILFVSDDQMLTLTDKEPLFIAKHSSCCKLNPSFGYNETFGGEGSCGVPISCDFIVQLALQHFVNNGSYPNRNTKGQVVGGYPGDTWGGYDSSLAAGWRGLTGGSSLAKLLERELGVRNHRNLPDLSENQILELAKSHFSSTGKWPKKKSGPVVGGHPGDTWGAYQDALVRGRRGLPGGSSLAKLLSQELGIRNHLDLPGLTTSFIVERAIQHHEINGVWPTLYTKGQVIGGHPGDTWNAYQIALCQGRRGLPGGSSLTQLLSTELGVRNRRDLTCLTENGILELAKLHLKATGKWPSMTSGSVTGGGPGDTWKGYDHDLRRGARGLPGGSSLAQLIRKLKQT